jgi:hypothetical protein
MAQKWLRDLTFGELKQIFSVRRDAQGPYLALNAASRFETASANFVPFALRLRSDNDRPYASPHEWAAFALTGA